MTVSRQKCYFNNEIAINLIDYKVRSKLLIITSTSKPYTRFFKAFTIVLTTDKYEIFRSSICEGSMVLTFKRAVDKFQNRQRHSDQKCLQTCQNNAIIAKAFENKKRGSDFSDLARALWSKPPHVTNRIIL